MGKSKAQKAASAKIRADGLKGELSAHKQNLPSLHQELGSTEWQIKSLTQQLKSLTQRRSEIHNTLSKTARLERDLDDAERILARHSNSVPVGEHRSALLSYRDQREDRQEYAYELRALTSHMTLRSGATTGPEPTQNTFRAWEGYRTLRNDGTTGPEPTRFSPYLRVKFEPGADRGGLSFVPAFPNRSQGGADFGAGTERARQSRSIPGLSQPLFDDHATAARETDRGAHDSRAVPTGPRVLGGPYMASTAPKSGVKNANLEPLGPGARASGAVRTATTNACVPPLATLKNLRQPPSEEGELVESSPSPFVPQLGLTTYPFGAPLTALAGTKRSAEHDETYDISAKRVQIEGSRSLSTIPGPFTPSSAPVPFGTAEPHHRLEILDWVPEAKDIRDEDENAWDD
ncbi:hypothetical protein BU16DRAFT_587013 [Lophium mytilinum]|uniref:Uncharacterized protein n=1 Tax=Lophium mytilinum TaxID=390894 RepID=A0A6A6QAN2_9PEZI|nr:hypothetical protein BU16DRAFT_587013 [Lophium mytilinum]